MLPTFDYISHPFSNWGVFLLKNDLFGNKNALPNSLRLKPI